MEYFQERIQAYFAWAKKVTDNIHGVNEQLESALAEMYKRRNLM